MDLLKTPLYEEHLKCHGKMVEFAGTVCLSNMLQE